MNESLQNISLHNEEIEEDEKIKEINNPTSVK